MTPDTAADRAYSPENTPATTSERQSSSWDIRNAPRNYISLVLTQIGSAAFSFGAVWLITRNLGSEGYGGIVAIIAASQVAQIFVNWTGVAVVRFGVDEFIETRKIARTFWVRLIVLVVNLAVVLLLADLWFPPLAGWLKLSPESFWLVLTHFAVTVLWIHVQMSLQAAKMPRVQGILQMIERLLIFAGLVAFLSAKNLTGSAAMLCYIIPPVMATAAGLAVLRPHVFARFSIDQIFLKKIFAYSLPLLPFSLVGYFSGSYVDAVFVSNFLSTKDLGIYSVATQINGIALQLPTLANTLLLPMFISLQKESQDQRAFNYLRNVLPSLTLLSGVACSAISLIGYFALPFIFGPEFSAATGPLWILLTASAISIPILIGYSAISNATSTTYISMIAAILSAVVNVVFNFILIPRLGITGSAWATLIAFFISVTAFAVLLNRSVQIPISWTFFAVIPSICGVVTFSLLGNPWAAFLVCLATGILVAYFFRDSLRRTAAFMKNFRAA
ncbi:MAG: lipopolysaccharide biosynthesis protein [Blastocatellia bacterium]